MPILPLLCSPPPSLPFPPTCVLSAGYPDLIVPYVPDQCVRPGVSHLRVTWNQVRAYYADEQAIKCSDSDQDTTDLTLSGGTFGLGHHRITCTVSEGGCATTRSFEFELLGKVPATGILIR